MVGSHKDNTYLQQFNVLHALTWYAVKCACGLIGNRSILRNGCSNVPWRLCASSHLGEPPQCFSMALDLCRLYRGHTAHSTHNTLGIVHKGNQQHTTETLGKFHTENITFSFANSMYKVACVCDLVLSMWQL